jgi:methylglyoxal synthase
MIDSYIDREDFAKPKALKYLSDLYNILCDLNESNFEVLIKKIFFIKETKEINIDNKQKSYYAFKR